MKIPASSLKIGDTLSAYGDRVIAIGRAPNFRKVRITRVYPDGKVRTGEWWRSTLIGVREQEKIGKPQVDQYSERSRQRQFAEEQSRESVFTRPCESIVDVDN